MLCMYAACLEGATEADIHAIKQAMEKRPAARAVFLDARAAISAVNAAEDRVQQIVIRPLKSPEFGSRSVRLSLCCCRGPARRVGQAACRTARRVETGSSAATKRWLGYK
jgi:hypothetical protein